ncbi:MAG: ribonuclease III domain-containing protein [Clostridia bacterium]|nr:ribonuclease III domain-containing protein [Clostridia bacterium]
MISIYDKISKNKIKEFNPLALAFIGDSVHTLFIRDYIMREQNLTAGNYHLLAAKFCKAQAQSKVFDSLFNDLTDEEKKIALQARNHKSHTAKNANPEDYKKATAFEAVLGYQYLIGNSERLNELLEKSLKNS